MRRHYKTKSSNFNEWEQKEHAENYMLFQENIGEHLSIDELSLSRGELYTFVTNKEGKGKKGTLVASIKGTLVKDIEQVLEKIPLEIREKVKEVTLDMASNMEAAASKSFPKAQLVTDRFHVVRLATEELQHIRIAFRWKELKKENKAIARAKKKGLNTKQKFLKTEILPNNCWLVADILFLRSQMNGHKVNKLEQNCCLKNTRN